MRTAVSRFQSPLALTGWLFAAALAGMPMASSAQGFAAYITPPRFEVQVAPGQNLRQVVEIHHVGTQKGSYRLYTNDWSLQPDGSLVFSNELAADSCRPWVAVERRELQIEPGARYRYRFEITPPPGTPARECRFALMIEGLDTTEVRGDLNFPVSGRIGVIVYATVGDAAPQLEVLSTRTAQINSTPTPVVEVRNRGNAHGRLEGFLNATDASGARYEMAPSDLPILPGETRVIALNPIAEQGKSPPQIRFPLKVKGNLEWSKKSVPLDASFPP